MTAVSEAKIGGRRSIRAEITGRFQLLLRYFILYFCPYSTIRMVHRSMGNSDSSNTIYWEIYKPIDIRGFPSSC